METNLICNQARHPVAELGHQLSRKIFNLQRVLPIRCVGKMVAQNLWKKQTND